MTTARQRIEAARHRAAIQDLNQVMDEVDAELGPDTTPPVSEPTPEPEPEINTRDLANRLIVNGRTGGHKPQIKKAARYIDASNR